jgi:hypothetical protein
LIARYSPWILSRALATDFCAETTTGVSRALTEITTAVRLGVRVLRPLAIVSTDDIQLPGT